MTIKILCREVWRFGEFDLVSLFVFQEGQKTRMAFTKGICEVIKYMLVLDPGNLAKCFQFYYFIFIKDFIRILYQQATIAVKPLFIVCLLIISLLPVSEIPSFL